MHYFENDIKYTNLLVVDPEGILEVGATLFGVVNILLK
jgi:hypothetical protein